MQAVSFSQDGAYLVAASGEPGLFGEAKLWKVDNASLVKSFRGHKDALLCAKLSPDGKLLATGSYDQTIILWNVETVKPVATLEGHNGAVFELDFHPRGHIPGIGQRRSHREVVACARRRTARYAQGVDQGVVRTRLPSSGEQLVAGGVDNRIRLWRIHPEGKENESPLLESKFAHEQAILRLAYSADGKTLVSSGEDRLVKVWNSSDLSNRTTLEKQPEWPAAAGDFAR